MGRFTRLSAVRLWRDRPLNVLCYSAQVTSESGWLMKRVLIVGTSGAGKSTLAKRVATLLGVTFYPTDGFYWENDWHPAPIERVDQRLDEVLQAPDWILDR